MSIPINRRQFVRRLAAAGFGTLAASGLLSGCKATPIATEVPPTQLPTTIPSPLATLSSPTPAAALTPTAAAAAEYPHLVVATGADPAQLVRHAMAALGGMGQFVRPGNDVIVKPNICVAYHTYEYAATTNPWVVAELVRMCLEAGARRVRVMDQPFGGTAEEAYKRSGIQDQVVAAGGVMEVMARYKFVSSPIAGGVDLKEWEFYDDALNADVVIDVPIAKHHGLARLTLGMKNIMGLITNRSGMHRDLGQRLAEITSRVRPQLTVIDAVRILMANGPTGGNLADVKKMDTLIVSPDIVAADAMGATLFGLKPSDIACVPAGVRMGLGRSDLENLAIERLVVGT